MHATTVEQYPSPGDFLLYWQGDELEVTLTSSGGVGKAVFRTDMSESGSWTDIPMTQKAPGIYSVKLPLTKVGIFEGKACFFKKHSPHPVWPEGGNLKIKVLSDVTRSNNSIYTVFPRQFGSFREVARRLDFIMKRMGFRIIQTLPPFPVPTTYAVMGEYGCPFASLDFFSVDPAMAEFDTASTPMEQFKELIEAVHSRKGLFFIDLPANHTGWASVLQTHHPEWFQKNKDGSFKSPGAWGIVWEDLVELDYSHEELRRYMAEVFLFWCRNGVDGFRCDAGYMIPNEAWRDIVAAVRQEYPDTVFMLEGLGGDISLTDLLLSDAGLDWAYSEIFQTYDRSQFEWYLPKAIERSQKFGTLVNFAETHDNNRLAEKGQIYAKLRVQLAALLSFQGSWGIANGVEWFAKEKIDVHGRNDLSWGSQSNMVELIAKLNTILSKYEIFSGRSDSMRLITRGGGNTLAVLRGCEMLVLANLDCEHSSRVEFDHSAFAYDEAEDVLTGKRVNVYGDVELSPGGVMCLVADDARLQTSKSSSLVSSDDAFFTWDYPEDLSRDFIAPEAEKILVSAPSFFRLKVVEPATNKTLYFSASKEGDKLAFTVPEYKGDGYSCRRLQIIIEVYFSTSRIERAKAMLLVTPPLSKAKVPRVLDKDRLLGAGACRTVLANSAGAISQVRGEWGLIQSQYDAFLSANPDPECPSDRINLWARTRAWLQHDGYSHEFNKNAQKLFFTDPEGKAAKWVFSIPCGLGRVAEFEFVLSLARGRNAARLTVTRLKSKSKDLPCAVRLVLRPDLEWRSYHATTKAYEGAEGLFPASVKSAANSFIFAPYEQKFVLRGDDCLFHVEPEWTYNVSHIEEAERGQSPSGDLFSPGWIEAQFMPGDSIELIGSYADALETKIDWLGDNVDDIEVCNLTNALRKAMNVFIVKRNELKTVIAGYPWFLDWGRDTFIFMRGMMSAGMYDDALKILRAFAKFEDRGTLPNIIYGRTAGNRDTVDAPLWFIRCVYEIEKYVPKDSLVDLRATCVSIVENYMHGTPNGIKADEDSCLVWSPQHFTWMDTNYPACTPREGYPIEVQALWVSALKYLKRDEAARLAISSIKKYFKTHNGYGDCLDAPRGVKAADAILDTSVRPNQLFLITLGVLEDDASPVDATKKLIIPGSIRSLSSLDKKYRGVYTGDEDTSRKHAYHNGTAWAWVFPTFCEAAWMTERLKSHAVLSLLASSVELMNAGCIAQICEISDGDAPHNQKGCAAQAWSVSEFTRVIACLTGRGGAR
ncbi:MAG: glycogen debranching enzyme N-terminal domain-containing protein [Kiritimatiellae bacterium]|nr:glycogen debranching enzyme N-terminal domain-containing protein [Kiritimatiellia bacterium]